MTHWQILRASKASRVAPGSSAHHGHGVKVHYSTAAVDPDSSRSFCVSTDKLTMQELNRRLESYLQQVQDLEAANQKLECQILQEVDRKCPRDLKQLDCHLKTVSLLRDQISEHLSLQGQLKLQLLTAELYAFNLNVRCEKEQRNRGRVEAELQKLRLLGEELMMHKLPELQKLFKGHTQQMMELSIQHQQNVQGLLAQVSRGVDVEMQIVQSADLKLQLNDRRHTGVTLFHHNQDECWFNNQVPTLTFDRPAVSEVIMVELKQLRGTAASLEEELMLLQAQNMQLESSGQQQTESSVMQLELLQQRADSLCRDLDSALQAAAQQAANHQDLLDVKSRLEDEIRDYRRLLDRPGCQWVSKPADMSFSAPSNTAAFRRKVIQDQTVSFQGGNLNMGAVQTKGYIGTVRQTPVFTPLSETVTTVQSIKVQNNSPLTSINTSNLTGSFHKSENQKTGALPDRTERKSPMINRWSSLLEDKVHAIDPESFSLKQTTVEVGFKAGTSTNTEITKTITGADVEQETHFITQTTTTDPGTQTVAEVVTETETAERGGYVHAKNQDPAQVVPLMLETQAEVVRDAGEVVVTAFKVSGSEGVQGEVSCEVTLIDDKNREEVEVQGTSLVHGLHQSLSLCNESISKQNDMKEDADVGSGLPTASSCSANSDDILVRESITASADTLRKSMTMNRWSSLLEDKVHAIDPESFSLKQTTVEVGFKAGTSTNTEITKTITGADVEQETHFITQTTTTDPGTQTLAEVVTETETAELGGYVHAKNQDPAQVVPLMLETQAEVVRDAGEVVVTAFKVSGSEGVQGEVSCEVTLIDDKNREEVEVEVEGTSLVHGLHQSLSLCDESISKQNDMKEDADVGSGLPKASSCSANNDDILVRESITASADTLRKSMTMNRWSSLLEDKVHAIDPDLLNESIVGAQISLGVEERSVMSLKLETQTEVVRDAGEVVVTAFKMSEGVQGEVSCESTLIDDKNREEVEGTLLVHGLHQNLSFCEASNSKQNNVKEHADAGSGLLTASSCSSDRNHNLNTESITASAETLRKSMTFNRWSSLLEDKVHAIDPYLLVEGSVVMSSKTEINTTTGITSLLPDTQPARSAGVQAESESFSLKQTTIEVKEKEASQLGYTEGYVHAKNQDPAQVVPLKLETQAEVVRDAGEVVVTAFKVSGSEGVQGEISCEVTLMDDKNREEVEVEVEGTSLVHGLHQSLTLCSASNSKQNNMKEDADVMFGLPVASSCSANSDDVKVASLTDCGVILSSCDAEKPLSTTVPVACLIETEVCPTEPEMALSQNDSETCLTEVEAKVCLSLIGEEDDEVSLSLTEASACVRPVEKYILSTKEESWSTSFSRAQPLLEVDRNRKVTTSVKRGSSLRFESFDGRSVGSLETRYGSEDQKETSNMGREARGQRNSDCLIDNKAGDSFGSVPAPGGTSFSDAEGKMRGMICSRGGMTASFDGTAANSVGTVGGDTEAVSTAEVQGEIRRGSGEWMVHGGNLGRTRLPSKESEENPPVATLPVTSQPGTGRFGKRGSGEWMVYGGSIGRKSSLDGNVSLPNTGSEDSPSVATQLATNPPGTGRFGSTGSGEWRVYGGSTGSLSSGSSTERMNVSATSCKIFSTTCNQMSSEGRLSSAGSVLRRSSSLGSAEKLSISSGNHMISSAGRFSSTGSGEFKPVYSSASGRKSSVGSGGRPSRGKTTTRHRTHSPGDRRSVSGGSGGWLSTSQAGGNRISSTGNAPKLSGSGSNDRISRGRGKGSPRLGRASSAGGRVITSNDRPVRSTGSGTGATQERISVCKMAALSMSAAGRERSQERQRQAQRSAQQEASASPLIQRWLTSAVEVPMAEPDGLDDIIRP